jgi:hypothetical protein
MQSKHCPKRSVRMGTLPEYALELESGEKKVSFDIQAGYRHFLPALQMRYWFLFRYDGRFHKCIALPVGWGRSPMWLSQRMVPMIRYLKQQYRVLAYLNVFCRLDQFSRTSYVDDNSCLLVSSLPLLFSYTITSHRDIYIYIY